MFQALAEPSNQTVSPLILPVYSAHRSSPRKVNFARGIQVARNNLSKISSAVREGYGLILQDRQREQAN